MRQRLLRVLGGAAVALLLGGSAAACGGDGGGGGGGAAQECGFKIAFFGALTGSAAALGINESNGAELAVEQYNAKHADCKVEFVKLDSGGSPDKAPGLAQGAINDQKILGIVGPAFSGENEAAGPFFNEAGLVAVTPSATRPSLSTKGWKTFFRGLGNDASQGPAAANYIKNVMKPQRVFVVDDQSAYGTGLADEVKKVLGATVVATDRVQGEGKQTNFEATVTKIRSSAATVVFFGGYYQEAGLILKQMRAAGVTATMVGGDGMKDDALITTAGASAAEGAIVTCPCAPPEKAKGTFVADYTNKFKVAPGTYSDISFDVANILLSGIEKGNTTRPKLLEYVRGYSGEGVVGKYKFEANGELSKDAIQVWSYKVSGGKIVADQQIPQS